jgi:hypothetical protein
VLAIPSDGWRLKIEQATGLSENQDDAAPHIRRAVRNRYEHSQHIVKRCLRSREEAAQRAQSMGALSSAGSILAAKGRRT